MDDKDIQVKVKKVSRDKTLIQEVDDYDELKDSRRVHEDNYDNDRVADDLRHINNMIEEAHGDYEDSPDIDGSDNSDPVENTPVASGLKPFPRLHLLDGYRGLVILVMIAYHFSYDLFVLLKGNYNWPAITGVFIWEQYICWSFNLLSGFVWQLGKKHCIKRGIIVNLCGFLCTFVTMIIMPEAPIIFGVLNLLGCAMILMYPISYVVRKVKPVVGAIVSFVLFLITYGFPWGYIGIYRLPLVLLPNSLYVSDIFAPYGFPSRTFVSSDYFPIFPWLFLYVTGFFLWKIISPIPAFQRIATRKIPVLDFIGKHSLAFYLIHQPVCFGLIYAFAYFFRR